MSRSESELRPDYGVSGHHFFNPWFGVESKFRQKVDITWGWDELRKDTGVRCRLHDLRHTFAARLAENGVPDWLQSELNTPPD